MRYILLISLCLLTACATPVTTMRKGDSVVTCGGGTVGSVLGGKIGYDIQRGNDKDCVNGFATQGYVVAKP